VSDDDLYFASARDLAAPIRLDKVSRSRIERELMRREVEHVAIFLEGMLRAVAVVNVQKPRLNPVCSLYSSARPV
jgi:hypothetical protein